nr:S8 family serine peptidase [Allomuricauda sp.]
MNSRTYTNKKVLIQAFIVLVIGILTSCTIREEGSNNYNTVHVVLQSPKVLDENELKNWQFKDIFSDSLPGISLNKTYDYISNHKNNLTAKKTTVAVIDMTMAIDHIDLVESIWINEDEIAGNSIDDDGNGFVDDINGWNFLGKADGSSIEFMNYEYTRILREFNAYYKGEKDTANLKPSKLDLYQRALKKYESQYKLAESQLKMEQGAMAFMKTLDSTMETIFKGKAYNTVMLDSILPYYRDDPTLATYIENKKSVMEHGVTDQDLRERLLKAEERINTLLNLDLDERAKIKNHLETTGYGNGIVDHNTKRMNHGTTVGGVIAANRENGTGAMGISDNIELMPLVISGFGDENDIDLTAAIKYAVDNGADIINISSGKGFSIQNQMVMDAIKYAEQNDVLIVHSAGNYASNLDEKDIYFFPNDTDTDHNEIVNNFINVGASTYHLNQDLISSISNYGVENVDIFAPGEDILTIDVGSDSYKYERGTSLSAAIVSGIAGMIKSYFPKLSAKEIKQILLTSGIAYHLEVETGDGKKDLFSRKSKSGKIVNAFQAFLLAEQMSKQRNTISYIEPKDFRTVSAPKLVFNPLLWLQ